MLDDEAKEAESYFGVTVNELDCVYLMNWNNKDGLAEFERATKIFQNMKHSAHKETTMAQINISFVYADLGRYEEASHIFEVALKDRPRRL